MSTIFTVDNVPVSVVSVEAANLDVDNVVNKSCIVIGASNTAGHVIVQGSAVDYSDSTRIMYGDTVAKLIQENGTEVLLYGNNIDRFCLTSLGVLVNLNYYQFVTPPPFANLPYPDVKYMLSFSASSGAFPTYGSAKYYRWSTAAKAFVWEMDANTSPDVNILLIRQGVTATLDGLLKNITKRSVDVDEDGPYMQYARGFGTAKYATQFSIHRETITTEYTATMVESTDCEAVNIQLSGGVLSEKKYREMTLAEGLAFLDSMRTKHERNYAPSTVCPSMSQKLPVFGLDANNAVVVKEYLDVAGKESNYSLSNLIERHDFVYSPQDEEIGLVVPCSGSYKPITQAGGSGAQYTTGQVYVASDSDTGYAGMITYSPPRVKSYAPKYVHVEFDAASHTLTWSEQTVISYILFNQFAPSGTAFDLKPAWGAGGYNMVPAMFAERVEGEEGAGGAGVPAAPWA